MPQCNHPALFTAIKGIIRQRIHKPVERIIIQGVEILIGAWQSVLSQIWDLANGIGTEHDVIFLSFRDSNVIKEIYGNAMVVQDILVVYLHN